MAQRNRAETRPIIDIDGEVTDVHDLYAHFLPESIERVAMLFRFRELIHSARLVTFIRLGDLTQQLQMRVPVTYGFLEEAGYAPLTDIRFHFIRIRIKKPLFVGGS